MRQQGEDNVKILVAFQDWFTILVAVGRGYSASCVKSSFISVYSDTKSAKAIWIQ
jgi:hypothetical protein